MTLHAYEKIFSIYGFQKDVCISFAVICAISALAFDVFWDKVVGFGNRGAICHVYPVSNPFESHVVMRNRVVSTGDAGNEW